SLVRLHAREVTLAGHAETLLRTAVALDLRHGVTTPRTNVKHDCTRAGREQSRPLRRALRRSRCRGARGRRARCRARPRRCGPTLRRGTRRERRRTRCGCGGAAALWVLGVAPAHAEGELELVAVREGLRLALDLRLDVVVVGRRRAPDLLPRRRLLSFLRLFRFLLLLQAVLAGVEDLRDRRYGIRRDLHEVVAELLCMRERALRRLDAKLFAVGAEEAHGWNADLVIDPQFGRGYRRSSAIRRGAPLALVSSTRKRISPREQRLEARAHLGPLAVEDRVAVRVAQTPRGHEAFVADRPLELRADALGRLFRSNGHG